MKTFSRGNSASMPTLPANLRSNSNQQQQPYFSYPQYPQECNPYPYYYPQQQERYNHNPQYNDQEGPAFQLATPQKVKITIVDPNSRQEFKLSTPKLVIITPSNPVSVKFSADSPSRTVNGSAPKNLGKKID